MHLGSMNKLKTAPYNYRRPSLFADFLSAVSLIRGPRKNIPKFSILGISFAYSRFFFLFFFFFLKEFGFKMTILKHTVLPRYPRFQYSRYFDETYLPQITRQTCTKDCSIKIPGYCYHSVNVIISESDHIKWIS